MASCEMCGKTATTKARVEGTILAVCASCAQFGKEFVPPKPAAPLRARVPQGLGAVEQELHPEFGKLLRSARQKRGLSEEDAARALAITKTALLGYESGRHIPDDATAKKLGRYYGITLFE